MTTAATTRILIADDHPIFRDGLRHLLQSEPSFAVVGEASDGAAAVALVDELKPDVLLLDVAMPKGGGLDALAALAGRPVRVILLTAAIDSRDVLHAIKLGARGLALKDSATRQLIDGIHRVIDGKFVMDQDVTDDLTAAIQKQESRSAKRYGLTAREREIVAAVVAGESNRDIALRLSISTQTVKHHLTSIFDKTGISTRLELALLAIREELVVDADST
jgi:DNA-binding NarL/FixJ family response regulator